MNLTRHLLLLPPVRYALQRQFTHSLLFGLTAGSVVCLLGLGVAQLPHIDAAAFQARTAALEQCSSALAAQRLAGHRLDGVRLLPGSVRQRGEQFSMQYHAREHGAHGWNSGPLLTVNCTVAPQSHQAHLSLLGRQP
ncbi:hypothetical protein ACFSR9_01495 [Deinococcus taklimakanensis]|uniref:Uncharacterized protein n=1 Tax=Deinococcus taklimakanensis TaxID=536443 RepID=A0ABW5NYX4_9DEIO